MLVTELEKNKYITMKNFIGILFLMTALTGCAVVNKAIDLWPRDHDPVISSTYINLQLSIENTSCDNKASFNQSITIADWLNRYSVFRNDPQKVTTEAIVSNLRKASEASDTACKRYVNIANINMKNLKDSWSKR